MDLESDDGAEHSHQGQHSTSVDVLGLPLADVPAGALAGFIVNLASPPRARPTLVFHLHVGGLLELDEPGYREAMTSADLIYADGVSAVVLAKLGGARRIERNPTTDLGWQVLHSLREILGRTPRVAAVGGPPGLAQGALETMQARGYGEPAYSSHGYHESWEHVLQQLRRSAPDIVFVGLGTPTEMVWAVEHRADLPSSLIMSCGGWFGYIVGEEPRAPKLMQRLGLEWVFRLWGQPTRLASRYARGLLVFPTLVISVLSSRVVSSLRRC